MARTCGLTARRCCALALAVLPLAGATPPGPVVAAPVPQNSTTTTTDTIPALVQTFMEMGMDDATWVLTSAFVILTMQSGFGSLESGSVDKKFEVNVMMKNVIDVVFGGLSYWMVGYGISFGKDWHSFLGSDKFFVNVVPTVEELVRANPDGNFVDRFSHYMFQFTFASTATTIVSGCVAGRMKFTTYIVFSFMNTVLYAFPCHWAWGDGGFLAKWGYTDFAGDGPVHLMGGVNGLVGAWLVGPRPGRFDPKRQHEFGLQNPLSCIFGCFMLWWGWLGFNCGSTYGVSNEKWLVAARVAVTTINASIGGGVTGVVWSYFWRHKGLVNVECVINGILSALVGITGGCAAVSPVAALVIGVISCWLCLWVNEALLRCGIADDPVGAVGVHGIAALWGLLAMGFFSDNRLVGNTDAMAGIFYGGGWQLLLVQAAGAAVIVVWTAVTSALCFKLLEGTIGIRATKEEIEAGFDVAEHGVGQPDWLVELEAAGGSMEEHLPAMAREIESLRIEVLEARSAFEAQQWELEALRHKHDCGFNKDDPWDQFNVEETDAN